MFLKRSIGNCNQDERIRCFKSLLKISKKVENVIAAFYQSYSYYFIVSCYLDAHIDQPLTLSNTARKIRERDT